jgi:uncharacterized protein (DUF1697 family)
MADLRALAAGAGLSDVVTYLQSGNVVGRSTDPAPRVAAALAAALADEGVDVPVLGRSGGAWAEAVAANPLVELDDDPRRLHVAFFDRVPDAGAVEELARRAEGGAFDPDRVEVVGDRAYLHTPGGYADSALTNAMLERSLGVVATTRNWRTTLALTGLAAEMGAPVDPTG